MKKMVSIPLVLSVLLLTSGCVSKQVKRVNEVQAQTAQQELSQDQLMDVTVIAFDPNVPETLEEQKKELIFPSVRQAEANYMPQVLRQTLADTGYWGTVRVLPESTPASQLTVGGRILHSDGEKLELRVVARDATGRKWLDRTYEETAAELSYTEKSIRGLDPFQDLYSRVSNDLLKVRQKLSDREVLEVRRVADLKFASDIAPSRFEGYLAKDRKGRYSVQRLPPEGDPIVARVEDVRYRDEILVDTLDAHYAAFKHNMEPAYQEWRKSSYTEVIALRELENQSLGRKLAGAAAIAGGIAALVTAENAGTAAAGQLGIIGGVALVTSGFQKGKEAQLHAESIKELNESINDDLEPRVVNLEGKTVTLTGSAKDQYAQWRKLLQERWAAEIGETTP